MWEEEFGNGSRFLILCYLTFDSYWVHSVVLSYRSFCVWLPELESKKSFKCKTMVLPSRGGGGEQESSNYEVLLPENTMHMAYDICRSTSTPPSPETIRLFPFPQFCNYISSTSKFVNQFSDDISSCQVFNTSVGLYISSLRQAEIRNLIVWWVLTCIYQTWLTSVLTACF